MTVSVNADAVISQVAARLRDRGERMTAPRRAVIRALVGQGGHLDAEQILDAVGAIDAGVHRASVYRALSALSRADIVHHIHEGHGGTVYHLRAEPHLHAQCEQCGDLIDVRPDLLDAVAATLRDETAFTLHADHVALSGVCVDCARGGSSSAIRNDDVNELVQSPEVIRVQGGDPP